MGTTTTAEIPGTSCDVARMPLADFVHLRVHTAYSLSAGAIRIKELVGLCQAERMPAVAVTDTGNLFGALEVATTCSRSGRFSRSSAARSPSSATGRRREARRVAASPNRIGSCCLAQNEAGYRNLLGSRQPILSRGRGAERAGDQPFGSRRRQRGASLPDGRTAGPGRPASRGGPGRRRRGRSDRARGPVSEPALCRADAPRDSRTRRGPSRASSSWRIVTICRSSRPTTPIFPIASFTRRTTRCSASPRPRSSPTRNANG